MENIFHLPVKSYKDNRNKNFKSYIVSLFDIYKKEVNSLKILNENEKQKIYDLSESLEAIYSLYMSGFSGEAYKKFDNVLKIVSSEIDVLSNVMMGKKQCEKIKNLYEKNIDDLSNRNIEEILKTMYSLFEYEYSDRFDSIYYRVRSISEEPENLSKYQLFHQPFENHEEINNYRYSIAGFPCLYLGKSFAVCNREIGEKSFESLWIMKYNLEGNLKCLDLSKSPNLLFFELTKLKNINQELLDNFNKKISEINKIIDQTKKSYSRMNRKDKRSTFKGAKLDKIELLKKADKLEVITGELRKLKKVTRELNKISDEKLNIKEFGVLGDIFMGIAKLIQYKYSEFRAALVMHPLMMSSSIKVSNYRVFKPEYIIPQFLMQWLRTSDEYWGVKYISTKYDFDKQKGIENYYQNINVAIPARQWSETGYCVQLRDCFSISEPINLSRSVERFDLKIIDNKLINLETKTKF